MLLAQSASASSSITMIIAYVILFGAIIYFMTIRPQKKQQKAADEMHAGWRQRIDYKRILWRNHRHHG